jgi:hypothetical protein
MADFARKDPEEAERIVRTFDEAEISLMSNNKDFMAWLLAATLRYYASIGDLEQLFGHLYTNTGNLERIGGWLREVPSYGEALDSCAESDPAGFLFCVDQYQSADLTAFLKQRARVAAVLTQGRADQEAALNTIPAENWLPVGMCACGHLLDEHVDVGCISCECAVAGPVVESDVGGDADAVAGDDAACGCGHPQTVHLFGGGPCGDGECFCGAFTAAKS